MLSTHDVTHENIPDLLGRVIESPYLTIDTRLRTLFEEATMIDEFMTPEDRKLYPEGLLEGFHLLGLLDHFISKYINWDKSSTYGLNYGLDRVRFVSPMQAGRPLRFRTTVTAVEPKHNGHLIRFDCVLEHEDADRPGMTASWLCYQLPTAEPPLDATGESDTR
ncbi:hypothetical protein [Streptomyces sp. NPDC048636]|uniref:hypothetical protein n=1 Tax=Streptomyces sp. NPDC048636 TaxID=3155762 RepID=UPI0034321E1D